MLHPNWNIAMTALEKGKRLNMKLFTILVCFVILTSSPVCIFAVETAPRISDREIIESLATLKEGQKALNERFDDMKWFLGTMIGILMLINCAVLGYVPKQQGALAKSLETMRDEINFLKSVVEKLLPPKGIL